MQQQIRLMGFFQRCFEARDQAMRQITNEPYGIAQQNRSPAGQLPATSPRIERRKQTVLGQPPRIGHGIHERALAGIGIADERDCHAVITRADEPLFAFVNRFELVAQIVNPLFDQATVDFELLFRQDHACRRRL